MTYEQLARITVPDSNERDTPVKRCSGTVDGQVPLLIEIKKRVKWENWNAWFVRG